MRSMEEDRQAFLAKQKQLKKYQEAKKYQITLETLDILKHKMKLMNKYEQRSHLQFYK